MQHTRDALCGSFAASFRLLLSVSTSTADEMRLLEASAFLYREDPVHTGYYFDDYINITFKTIKIIRSADWKSKSGEYRLSFSGDSRPNKSMRPTRRSAKESLARLLFVVVLYEALWSISPTSLNMYW